MTADREPRRRALLIYYERYLAADRAWRLAEKEAMAWFPAGERPSAPLIGNPGSRLRRLHDRRERAVNLLALAQLHLGDLRRQGEVRVQILFLPAR